MSTHKLTALSAAALLVLALAACSKSNPASQAQPADATAASAAPSSTAAPPAAAPASGAAMRALPSQPASRSSRSSATAARNAAPPVPQTVEVASGTTLPVRLAQALSSSNAQAGQTWQGQVAAPIRVNGQIAIPQGASVSGTIVAADAAGHFKGSSRLVLKLTTLEFNGASYDLASHEIARQTSSRGKTTAERVGIGAAIGGVVGALAGHGKGAAIGAATGAGAGTAMQALTKAPEVNLPAESLLDFTLSAPLKVVPAVNAQ